MLVFFFLWVKHLTFLVSGLSMLLLPKVRSVRCSRIFTLLISILVEVAITNFWYVLQRETQMSVRGAVTKASHCSVASGNHPLTSVVPTEDDENALESGSRSKFSNRLTEGIFASAQQLSRNIFTRVTSRHSAKFNHS